MLAWHTRQDHNSPPGEWQPVFPRPPGYIPLWLECTYFCWFVCVGLWVCEFGESIFHLATIARPRPDDKTKPQNHQMKRKDPH